MDAQASRFPLPSARMADARYHAWLVTQSLRGKATLLTWKSRNYEGKPARPDYQLHWEKTRCKEDEIH